MWRRVSGNKKQSVAIISKHTAITSMYKKTVIIKRLIILYVTT
nr:MAG TPA_asm: hypothetical protein [Caudoviricetes sp.]